MHTHAKAVFTFNFSILSSSRKFKRAHTHVFYSFSCTFSKRKSWKISEMMSYLVSFSSSSFLPFVYFTATKFLFQLISLNATVRIKCDLPTSVDVFFVHRRIFSLIFILRENLL